MSRGKRNQQKQTMNKKEEFMDDRIEIKQEKKQSNQSFKFIIGSKASLKSL